MEQRFHNTAMKIGVGDEAGWMAGFVPVALSGLDLVWFRTLGFRIRLTPGYIPAAVSRLEVFVVLSDLT